VDSVQSFSSEQSKVPAKTSQKGISGDASGRKQRRPRPTSRWQVGNHFSSDSDSEDGTGLLTPFGSNRAALPVRNSASEASKGMGSSTNPGRRLVTAARARLGFSSDSDIG